MRKLHPVVLLLVLVAFSCNKEKTKNFLESENIKGRVKTLSESFYAIEDTGGKIEKGKLFFKSVYLINANGNKSDWKEYNTDGSLRWRAISKYTNGMETECDGYEANGTVDWKSVYKYDDKGNRTEEEEFGPSGNKNFKIVFKYDDKGVKTGRDFFTADGNLYSRSEYKYDANGNEAEEKVYDGSGTLKSTNTSKYDKIDKNGNWLLLTQYANDKLTIIAEREISYYE